MQELKELSTPLVKLEMPSFIAATDHLCFVHCWTNQVSTDTVAVVDTVLQLNIIRSMQLLY